MIAVEKIQPGLSATASPPKAKILMVDDEPKNLLALESVLGVLGMDLVRARSGKEALRCLMQADFAVILLDVQMPEMDGFETAALIRNRAKNRNSPIIFLTAVGSSEAEMFQGYQVGAMDYLMKPFAPEILRHKVRVLIELHQKNAEVERLNVQLTEANASLERRVQERTVDLQARSLDLARSNTELAQFAAVASHDLQEPLRTLSTYLQMFAKRNDRRLDAEETEIMGVVLASASRMRELINALLALSQVGEGELKLERVDCGAVVQTTLAMLKEKIAESGAKVSVGPLPILKAEASLLGQVFQNLVENALKFHRGPGPVVKVTAHEKAGAWVFAVADQGIGIQAEHHEKIFKLFQRLHTREEYPGTGLGLSICKKAVERLGGKIWLESNAGQGSTFYFSLPIKG